MTEKVKDKNSWLGSVFVLTAGVCWGFIGFFSNHLSEAGYNSVQIAFLRNIVAAALVIALFGCACTTGIFNGVGSAVPAFGIFTGIASGFCYALYSIFGHIALKKYGTVTVTAYTFLVAAVSLLPFMNMSEILRVSTEPAVFINIVGIGIFSTLLPYIFYTMGLQRTEPGKAAVMAFVEPMVATLLSIFILKEGFTWMGTAGIAAIFVWS